VSRDRSGTRPRRSGLQRVASLALATLLAAAGAISAHGEILHRERSLYRNLIITQDGKERCLLFRVRRGLARESCILVNDPTTLVLDYDKMMLASLWAAPAPRRILVIGMGGANLPSALQQLLPKARLDVVEIDPAVARCARDYFAFRPGPNTSVTIEDGRVFVRRALKARQTYDLIMLDAFADDYIPEHMLTREFLLEVKGLLTPGGVVAANTWSNSRLYDHESTTYQAAFGTFFNMKLQNRVIIARNGRLPTDAELQANAFAWHAALDRRGAYAASLLPLMSTDRDWNPAARVLTDQYSPSNLLNAQRR